jgi:hypothetical protein
MGVRSVAVQLERLCKDVKNQRHGKERISAIRKAFRFLTGYETFEEGYNNQTKDRWMTAEGMGSNPVKDMEPSLFDTSELDDEKIERLGCVDEF